VSGVEANSYGKTTLVAIFLGIDGGGSKTSCLIGDETSVLGAGTGAASNVVRVGEAQARESLATAIQQACTVANIKPSEISSVCVGLAGAARPEISELVRGIVSEVLSGESISSQINFGENKPGEIEPCVIKVVGDMVIALEAAFGSGPGVIVIAGTGSIAYGRNREGQTGRAGGWGFAISDEGSGHWIGRTAVAAAIGAWNENPGQNVPLIEILLKFWRLATIEQLVPAANATPPPDFAALFPSVLSLADSGDRVALDVLNQAGIQLANLAETLIRRLFPNSRAVRVAMSGGVFRSSALVRQVFYNSLCSEHPNASLNPSVIEPVRGALELARKGAAK
jgi:glucosamine kinase